LGVGLGQDRLLIFRSPRTKRLRIGISPAALRGRRIAFGVVLVCLVAALGTALVWWMTGGHLFLHDHAIDESTDSGRRADGDAAGSLPLHVGEIVAFRPPGMGGAVFVHKIYAISDSHGQVLYRTKGF